MIDFTKLREKLDPNPGGEPSLMLRAATVSAVNADGTLDLILADAPIPDVPCLDLVPVAVGDVVQVLAYRGGLLVVGASFDGSGWIDYVPTFATGGGGANIGSTGKIVGRYRRVARDLIHAVGLTQFGGTGINTGSGGGFSNSLPVPAANRPDYAWIGTAYLRSAGGSGHYTGFCLAGSAASAVTFFESTTHAQVVNTVPFTWATGNFLRWSLTYEPAS